MRASNKFEHHTELGRAAGGGHGGGCGSTSGDFCDSDGISVYICAFQFRIGECLVICVLRVDIELFSIVVVLLLLNSLISNLIECES